MTAAPPDDGRSSPTIDIRGKLRSDPDFVVFLSGAFMLSSALFSAVELDVFDALEESSQPLAELASRLGVTPEGLDRLLVVLQALGLVERGVDARYRNAPAASQLLTRNAATSIRALVLHQQRHAYPLFAHVSEAVRAGEPQAWALPIPCGEGASAESPDTADVYAALSRSPDEFRLFLDAMNVAAGGVGEMIARRVDFTGIQTLVDLGGGGGRIAADLAVAVPHLRITIVDRSEAREVADAFAAHRGVADRVRLIPGDFLHELPRDLGPSDAVLLAGILADWDPAQRAQILANARRCLRPGGRLLVGETLLDDTNDGPLLPALFSLTMLLGMRGKNFTRSELEAELRGASFVDIETHLNRELGVRDLVVASRPIAG